MKKLTLGAVESFTGGLFASEIVAKPGASSYFKGSLVAYNNEIKEKLGVDTSNGVVNDIVAHEIAVKGKEFFNCDICVSFTGNAGPSAMENKEVGKVFIGINDKVYELNFANASRNEIRKKAVAFALDKLSSLIEF